jgi:hypothetical protein
MAKIDLEAKAEEIAQHAVSMCESTMLGADTELSIARAAANHALNWSAALHRYNQWVDDLQSGMYVNCVYCGHRYGPGESTPLTMAEALKEHVLQCPQHPMSELRRVAIAAWHALKSYEHGNSSAELAKEMCATLESTLGIGPQRSPAVERATL